MQLSLNLGLWIILFYYGVSGFGKCEPIFKRKVENNFNEFLSLYFRKGKALSWSLFTSPFEFWSSKELKRRKKDYDEYMFDYVYSGEFLE